MPGPIPIPDEATTAAVPTSGAGGRAVSIPIPDEATTAAPTDQGSGLGRLVGGIHSAGPTTSIPQTVKSYVTHPIDTFVSAFKELVGSPDSARGQLLEHALTSDEPTADRIVKIINSQIPLFGAPIEHATERVASGDVLGGSGEAIGIGLNAGLPKIAEGAGAAAGGALKGSPILSKIYQTSLKPTGTMVEKAAKVKTGLQEGLPTSEAGTSARITTLNKVGAQLGDLYRNAPQNPVISWGPVADALDDLAAKRGITSNADATAVQGVGNEFASKLPTGRDLTPSEAFDLKVAHQNKATDLKKGAYSTGADNGAAVEAHQTIAQKLGDGLVQQYPQAKALNARYSALSDIGGDLERAAGRSANQSLVTSIPALVSTITGVMTGKPGTGMATGAAIKMLADPAFRSRVAIALAKDQAISVPAAGARIGSYINMVGRSGGQSAIPQPVPLGKVAQGRDGDLTGIP